MGVKSLNQLRPGQGGKIVKVGGEGAIHRRILFERHLSQEMTKRAARIRRGEKG
jgi:hypothetical protein